MDSQAVAIDGTTLIAADSFVARDPTQRDPAAISAFEFVVDAFCSGRPMMMPHPAAKQEGLISPLFKLWGATGQHVTVEDTRKPVQIRLVRDTATAFATCVEDNPHAIASWLSHQFHPDNFRHYIGGGNNPKQLRAIAERMEWAFDRRGPKLSQALKIVEGRNWNESSISILKAEGGLKGADHIIGLSYAFQAAAKGVAYALNLQGNQTAAIYRTHWMRDQLLDKRRVSRKISQDHRAGLLFPWGAALSRLIRHFETELSTDPDLLSSLVWQLREFHRLSQDAWLNEDRGATVSFIRNGLISAGFAKHLLGESGAEHYARTTGMNAITRPTGGLNTRTLAADEIEIDLPSINLPGNILKERELRWKFDAAIFDASAAWRNRFPVEEDKGPEDESFSLQTSERFHYAAFFNGKDYEAVSHIVDSIEQYGYEAYFFPKDKEPGRANEAQIEDIVKTVPVALFFIGKYGLGSYQEHELSLMRHEASLRGAILVPVILESYRGQVRNLPAGLENSCIDLREKADHVWKPLIELLDTVSTSGRC